MVVHFNRLTDGGDYERIGTVEGEDVVDGGEDIERLVEMAKLGPSDGRDSIEDLLLDRYDGPYLLAESGG